jgi:ketosteroid isomerase-like protein
VSRDVVTRLYEAFAVRDHATMAGCYTPDARFSDPVFTALEGTQVAAMWRMLCERATDLRIRFRDVVVAGISGSAQWEAWYTYSATGRPVHNVISATFTLRDGLIAEHRDRFDLYRWARQALGTPGVLLGWTPFMQRAIRRRAAQSLARFSAT